MANPYRNTGKAGVSSPANLNIGGTLAKAGKALLKKFTKSKPVSNFKPFHRDGVTYDTKSFNQVFENRFGRPQNVIKEATEGKDALTHLKKVKKMAPKTKKVVKRDFFGRRIG